MLCLTAILFLIACVIYRRYLFGDLTYIFRDAGSDTFNQYWPVIEAFVRKVRHGELHTWIFSMGLGNTVTDMLTYVLDPFTLLLLFFPEHTLAYGLVWIAVLKEIVGGIIFYLFAREIGLRRVASMIAAICWAFSGFMVLWGQHYIFATVIPYFALVILGEAIFRHRGSGKLLIFALWLQAVISVYMSVWVIFGLVIEVLLLYILREEKSFRDFGTYLWGYLWRGGIAAGLSAFRWLPSVLMLLNSAQYTGRTAGNSILWDKTGYLSILLRGFSNNALGVSNQNVLGYNYYEQIMWASSILALTFLFHNVFVRKGKERTFCLVTGVLVLLSLGTRIGALIMNMGKDVTFRWSYLIVFTLIVNMAFAIEDIYDNGKTRIGLVAAEFLFCLAFLMLVFQTFYRIFAVAMPGEDIVTSLFVYRGCVCLLLTFFGICLLLLLLKEGKGRRIAECLLLGALCVEMTVLNEPTLNGGRVAVPKAGAYKMDYFSPCDLTALDWIKENDDGLYRSERVLISGGNDPLMMDYYGTFAYGVHGKEIGEFFERNGLNDPNGDFTSRISGNPVLESLLGVKYMLSAEPLGEDGYEEIQVITAVNEITGSEDAVRVNQNRYAFPLLYAANEENAGTIEAMIGGAHAAGSIPELLSEIVPLQIGSFRESSISGTLTTSEAGMLLTSIPYDAGWRIRIDGARVPTEVVNFGFVGASLPAGEHEITLSYVPRGALAGAMISLIGLAGILIVPIAQRKERKKS